MSPRLNDRVALAIVVLASAILQVPFLDRGISFYDEGSVLAIADGLHSGELLYRDRVTLLPPLTYEVLAGLFDIFGPSLLVGRLLQAVSFVACAALIYFILRQFLSTRGALLGALAFLPIKALAFPFWTVVNYSQVAMVFWLAATALTLRFLRQRRPWCLVAAGCAAGTTLVTKQNLGAALLAAVAVTIALDALREPVAVFRALAIRAAALFAGTVAPVAAVALFYAGRGTLGDLVDRVVVGLLYVQQLPIIPLPIVYGSADVGHIIFTYFPTALAHLAWQQSLDLLRPALLLPIGHAVKAVYFAPLLALFVGAGMIGLGWLRREARVAWSPLVLTVALAAVAYASMLYRADWTHLMNVAPPLLIVCVVILNRPLHQTRFAATLPQGLAVLWFLCGVLGAVAVFAVYDEALDTPRGRLFAPEREADDARHVLAYLTQQPATDQILILRADPLYYYLSGRRIPVILDLIMPALLGPEDDRVLSEKLTSIDQIVYNPKGYITLPTPVTEYVPRLARTLASDFRVVEVLAPTAVVLKPRSDRVRDAVTVVDLWDAFGTLQVNGSAAGDVSLAIERAHWMMYRVVASTLRPGSPERCFALSHLVGAGETLHTIPMLNPIGWAPQKSDPDYTPDATGAVFAITVRDPFGAPETIYREQHHPGVPPREVHLALDRFAGHAVAIRFCTTLPDEAAGSAIALAGWAEPRIVARSPQP